MKRKEEEKKDHIPARAIIPLQISLPAVLIGENSVVASAARAPCGKRDSLENRRPFYRAFWEALFARRYPVGNNRNVVNERRAKCVRIAGVIGRYALFLSRYRASTPARTAWENVYSSYAEREREKGTEIDGRKER